LEVLHYKKPGVDLDFDTEVVEDCQLKYKDKDGNNAYMHMAVSIFKFVGEDVELKVMIKVDESVEECITGDKETIYKLEDVSLNWSRC
jgi:hypothetical protein